MSLREIDIAPGLLVSMPQLSDPNFARAVVLMVDHDDEGSFGLILNSASELSVRDLLDALDLEWQGDSEQLVWSGGPVMPTSGWVVHTPSDGLPLARNFQEGLENGESILISPDLALSASPQILEQLASSPPTKSRFLLGYSGWGAGQLAEEMASGSWLHANISPELVFDTPAEDMWSAALRSIGVTPEIVVQSTGVH